MSDEYGFGSSRNKKRNKAKKKKENPYKLGGRFRSSNIDETSNKSSSVVNMKKKKK